MRSGKEIERKIKWCLNHKDGIKLEPQNENLCQAYIKKAKSALNMFEASVERHEYEWMASTAYYARYFALYALFKKCGIKSEIHDCSIIAMKYLFVNGGIIEEGYFKDIDGAKQLRVETQYYVAEEVDLNKIRKASEKSREFVLKIEEVIDRISGNEIKELRKKLSRII